MSLCVSSTINMYAFVFFLLALFSLFVISSLAQASNSLSFSIDLIHRDSPSSPFYNPSLTPFEHIKNAALRSIARTNHVFSHSLNIQNDESLESVLVTNNGGDYLMKIYIGTPPVERLVVADTGSDLPWVQCSPCENCFPQQTPLFEPTKSSTFTRVSCESQSCQLVPHKCGTSNECLYSYQYGDKSFTIGALGSDEINFGNNVTFPKSIFGCGFYNKLTYIPVGKPTGFAGLGAGPLSLISQLGDQIGHKFSYCLVPITSTLNSKIKFGEGAKITGQVVSTPLIIKPEKPTYYFLNLEGVTIGTKTVSTGQNNGNIIIDSGTVLTYLPLSFYTNFVSLLQSSIDVEAEQDIPFPFDFCFKYKEGMYFPEIITLQFTGASLPLRPEHLLIMDSTNNLLCLAVKPINEDVGVAILGNLAQMDFQVEYDLAGKKISFAPSNCSANYVA